MFAVVLALLAAMSWGFSAVLVRWGLRHVSTAMGTFVSLVAGLVFTGLLVALFEREAAPAVSLAAVVLFGVVGILNFPMGRFFNYLSMSRLGVGRSAPITASAPLFAVILAVLFTGESLSAGTVAGTALILGGLYVTLTAVR